MTLSARLLALGDEDSVDRFLAPHTPFAFFMRSNLRRGGIVFEGKPYQSDYFGVFDANEQVGVLTHSFFSSVQPFVADLKYIPALAQALRQQRANKPRVIECFVGPEVQAKALYDALGIDPSAFRDKRNAEWLYSLSLDKMILPASLQKPELLVRHAVPTDAEQLIQWRHDFNVEAIGAVPGAETYAKAKTEIERRISEGDLFVLEDRAKLVSFCGVGGFLPDCRMVGPVWTAPDQRGRGYARAVTAGALERLREQGVTTALLFAQRPDAERAYRAIGFNRIGAWALDFLKETVSSL